MFGKGFLLHDERWFLICHLKTTHPCRQQVFFSDVAGFPKKSVKKDRQHWMRRGGFGRKIFSRFSYLYDGQRTSLHKKLTRKFPLWGQNFYSGPPLELIPEKFQKHILC
jgi:hypothetical protein